MVSLYLKLVLVSHVVAGLLQRIHGSIAAAPAVTNSYWHDVDVVIAHLNCARCCGIVLEHICGCDVL
jgi:hypothetical protein